MTSMAFTAAWVPAPSEEAKVAAAQDAADVALTDAQRCWARYREALEENADVEARLAEFGVASAHARFAWAVYHATLADAAARSCTGAVTAA